MEKYLHLGALATLTAMKKTLSHYPQGLTPEEVESLLDEIDQQLGLRQTAIALLKQA